MKTVSSAVHSKIPIIIFNGTGRAADVLSRLSEHAQLLDSTRISRKERDAKLPGLQFPCPERSRIGMILLGLQRMHADGVGVGVSTGATQALGVALDRVLA